MDHLEKVSESTNQENGLLRAQVEQLQIELKEYRKRLSWVGSSGQSGSSFLGSSAPAAAARTSINSKQNDFQFEFPRFGDPSADYVVSNSSTGVQSVAQSTRSSTLSSKASNYAVPGVVGRNAVPYLSPQMPSPQMTSPSSGSNSKSPENAPSTLLLVSDFQSRASNSTLDSFSGLFSPSILEASRQASIGYFPPTTAKNSNQVARKHFDHNSPGTNVRQHSTSSISNTDSPTSSHESQQNFSSIGTSPEPSLSSPCQKVTEYGLNTISEETQPQNNFAGE